MQPSERPLRRGERALLYGLLGWAAEVAFTGGRDAVASRRRDWRLEGRSYLWMLPLYGSAALFFEPLHDAMRHRPRWARALVYAAGILAAEYASGTVLRRSIGVVPWEYRGATRWASPGGAIRLDYAPLWAATGLALEAVHDGLSRVRLRDPSAASEAR